MTAERLAEIRRMVQPGLIAVTDRVVADLASAALDLLAEHDAAAERRRYALLAAAAELHRRCSDDNMVDVADCVNTATLLLAEIERRAKP